MWGTVRRRVLQPVSQSIRAVYTSYSSSSSHCTPLRCSSPSAFSSSPNVFVHFDIAVLIWPAAGRRGLLWSPPLQPSIRKAWRNACLTRAVCAMNSDTGFPALRSVICLRYLWKLWWPPHCTAHAHFRIRAKVMRWTRTAPWTQKNIDMKTRPVVLAFRHFLRQVYHMFWW